MHFKNLAPLFLLPFFALTFSAPVVAQLPVEEREVTADDLKAMKWLHDVGSGLNVRDLRTREELCAILPPQASLRPNLREIRDDNLRLGPLYSYQSRYALHALLWSLKRSCSSGRLWLGLPRCGPGELIWLRYTTSELAARAVALWSGQQDLMRLSCMAGELSLDGLNIGDLEIRDIGFTSFNLLNSRLRNLNILNPQWLPPIHGRISIHKNEISGNISILGSALGSVSVSASKIAGNVLLEFERSLGGGISDSEIGGDVTLLAWKSDKEFQTTGTSASINNTRVLGTIKVTYVDLSPWKESAIVFTNVVARLLDINSSRATDLRLHQSRFEDVTLVENNIANVRVVNSEIERLTFLSNYGVDFRRNELPQRSAMSILIAESTLGRIYGNVESVRAFACQNCLLKTSIQWRGLIEESFALSRSRITDGIRLDDLRFAGAALLDLSQVQARFLALKPDIARASVRGAEPKPVRLRLNGSKFDFISGGLDFSAAGKSDSGLLSLPAEDLIQLISPSSSEDVFDPQPLTMLARMLTDAGYRDTASDLHVERIWRQLTGSEKFFNKAKGWIGYPIGYGYKPDPVLGVLVLLVLLGTAMSWWMFSKSRKQNLRGRRLSWYQAGWRHLRFVLSDFFVSIVHLVPSLFGSWSATALPKGKNNRSKSSKRFSFGENYFKFHTVLGSILIFLLLTPATGIFD